MRIESVKDLIEWTQARHAAIAHCLKQCATDNPDERASMILHYLASHEAKLEKTVAMLKDRAVQETGEVYDNPLSAGLDAEEQPDCNGRFANMSADQVRDKVFAYHDQIIRFYQDMIGKVKDPQAVAMMQDVLDMELQEAKLLVRQTGRMDDI